MSYIFNLLKNLEGTIENDINNHIKKTAIEIQSLLTQIVIVLPISLFFDYFFVKALFEFAWYFIIILFVPAWFFIGLLLHLLQKTRDNQQKIKNLKKSFTNHVRSVTKIQNSQAFILYLCNFSLETYPLTEDTGIPYGTLGTKANYSVSPHYSALRYVPHSYPVFSFSNYENVMENSRDDIFWIPEKLWFPVFCELAQNAILTIVDMNHISESITQELDWLLQHRSDSIFLIYREHLMEKIFKDFPNAEVKIKWTAIRETQEYRGREDYLDVKYPKELIEYLEKKRNPAPHS